MNNKHVIGVDIGGTKCAVTYSIVSDSVEVVDKIRFATYKTSDETIKKLFISIEAIKERNKIEEIHCIGISCGGPLNSKTGMIVCPPNLPGWVNIPIVKMFEEKYKVPVAIQNDANAGALAEWLWGAGKGLDNVIFLTFGTGMGAGLILDGRLYAGTNDLAGEVGHLRIENDGPIGFNKKGSFEGFCSGGGIARLAQIKIAKWLSEGEDIPFCKDFSELDNITAEIIGKNAANGDTYALEIFDEVSEKLGKGIAILVDVLNPQKIIIGSIYGRQKEVIDKKFIPMLKSEAIDLSLSVCEISTAELSEMIGDYAAAAVAYYHIKEGDLNADRKY